MNQNTRDTTIKASKVVVIQDLIKSSVQYKPSVLKSNANKKSVAITRHLLSVYALLQRNF